MRLRSKGESWPVLSGASGGDFYVVCIGGVVGRPVFDRLGALTFGRTEGVGEPGTPPIAPAVPKVWCAAPRAWAPVRCSALQCAPCHQDKNTANGKVSGAPHWHLAPLSMAWEGLTLAQICQQLKDPSRNGNRKTPEQVIEHMRVDPLVLWAWEPGAGRITPNMTHAQFIERLETWANAGMPCPAEVSQKPAVRATR